MPPEPRSLLRANAVAAAQAAVPVEAGEMTLTMRVRLVWTLAKLIPSAAELKKARPHCHAL
jgi:uncharacterized protein YggE